MTDETKHGSMVEALLAFQSEVPDLHKDKDNPAFRGSKYLSLDRLTDAVRPVLTRHGLVWSAMPSSLDGAPALSYRLLHRTGELVEGTMPLMLSKQDAQGQGSALTYARRYALMAVLNLVADEDDDGNSATTTVQERRDGAKLASEPQRRLIFAKAGEAHLTAGQIANVINLSAGAEPILFETEQEAQQWIDRALPKLPARLVNPIVENIAKVAA